MSCLGVHFAISEQEVAQLRSLKKEQARADYVTEVIEEEYFSEHPEWTVESDKSWDAMHRTLSDGQLNWNGGQYPLNHAVLAGELLSSDDHILSLKTPQQVHDIAGALSAISEDEFRRRYFAIDAKSYGVPLSDEEFRSTWAWFQDVRDVYTRASKENRFVLFSADQ